MHRKTDTRLIRRIVLLCAISILTILIAYLSISVCVTNEGNATPDEVIITTDITKTTESAVTPTQPTTEPISKPTTEKATEKVTEKPTEETKATKATEKNKKKPIRREPQTTATHYQNTKPIYTPTYKPTYKPTYNTKPTQQPTERQEIWDGDLIEP